MKNRLNPFHGLGWPIAAVFVMLFAIPAFAAPPAPDNVVVTLDSAVVPATASTMQDNVALGNQELVIAAITPADSSPQATFQWRETYVNIAGTANTEGNATGGTEVGNANTGGNGVIFTEVTANVGEDNGYNRILMRPMPAASLGSNFAP